jgi:hypothetical protein
MVDGIYHEAKVHPLPFNGQELPQTSEEATIIADYWPGHRIECQLVLGRDPVQPDVYICLAADL